MLANDILTLVIFCLLLGAHIWWRPFLERRHMLVFSAVAITVLLSLAIAVYVDFKTIQVVGPPTEYLIPPYTPWGIYLKTVFLRVFAPYTLSLLLACIALYICTKISFFKDRLYPNEALYICTAVFLMRHPYWMPYLLSLLALAILAAIIGTIRKGKEYRFSLHHLWLPSGIVTVLIFPFLSNIPFFNDIGFPNLY